MDVAILRLEGTEPVLAGIVRADRSGSEFQYVDSYLAQDAAMPLSISLPLRQEPYGRRQMQHYFEGLLPEGMARYALADQLDIPSDDTFALLAACGEECVGDVMARECGTSSVDPAFYKEVGGTALREVISGRYSLAAECAASHRTLGGAQGKICLACDCDGTWYRPCGTASSTHILKAPELRDAAAVEYLSMHAAKSCGIDVAEAELLDFGRPVLAVRRFDREASMSDGSLRVRRLPQEDLAQAWSVWPGGKYAEREGGTIHALAGFLRKRSACPIKDLKQLGALCLFSYAIGNCDAHLKNHSLHCQTDGVRLAPAYDLVSTCHFPEFSRKLAMDLGGERDIDRIGVHELELAASDLGISMAALRDCARRIAACLVPGIESAVERAEAGLQDEVARIAEELAMEMSCRIGVLQAFGG